jgi:hypothetical protein
MVPRSAAILSIASTCSRRTLSWIGIVGSWLFFGALV